MYAQLLFHRSIPWVHPDMHLSVRNVESVCLSIKSLDKPRPPATHEKEAICIYMNTAHTDQHVIYLLKNLLQERVVGLGLTKPNLLIWESTSHWDLLLKADL